MCASSRTNEYLKDLAACVAGLAFPFAFAPFDLVPLAYAGLGLLFYVWLDTSPGRAFLRGLLFGIGQFALGVYWIHVCVHDYAGSTDLAAFLISAAAVVFLALFPALAGFFGVLIAPTNLPGKLMVVFPGCWILLEWLRAWLEFPGFPWLQIGYSQLGAIPEALGPVLGIYGIGFFAAFSAATLVYCLQSGAQSRRATMILLALLWIATAFLHRYPWTDPAGKPISVALLQGNTAQQVKWQPETKEEILRWYIEQSRDHWGTDLIVWPETAVPIRSDQIGGLLEHIARESAKHGSELLIGLPIRDREQQRNYNGILILGNGEGRYLKRHLVPFGEYLPLKPVSTWIAQHMDFKMFGFRPGPIEQPLIKAAGVPLAASICYEDVFGQEMLASLPDALFLVNITNDAWFGRSIALDQNLQMSRMRSLETGRYMIRTANTGLTAIISPQGDLIKLAPPFTATVLRGAIQPMQGSTPYVMFGDYLVLAAIVLALFYLC
ncbi:MAG: apolipoprotein N-acyltransferase, partial [Gammaproteobacteria bacterium]